MVDRANLMDICAVARKPWNILKSSLWYPAIIGPIYFLFFTIYGCTEHNWSVFLVFQVFIAVCKRNCGHFVLGFFRVHEQSNSNSPRISKERQAGNEQKHFESTRKLFPVQLRLKYQSDNGQVPNWRIQDISRFSWNRTYIHGFLHGRSTIPN